MIVAEGHRAMEQAGFARFSARAVAKRVGYTIGTLYNVWGSHDRLVLAVNARTLADWARHLRAALAAVGDGDRIACLVRAYFDFAQGHPRAWAAVYDHRLPAGEAWPDWYADAVADLTGIVAAEVAAALPAHARGGAAALARSLLAVVHGHCHLAVTGAMASLGEAAPADAALARVREAIAAAAGETGMEEAA